MHNQFDYLHYEPQNRQYRRRTRIRIIAIIIFMILLVLGAFVEAQTTSSDNFNLKEDSHREVSLSTGAGLLSVQKGRELSPEFGFAIQMADKIFGELRMNNNTSHKIANDSGHISVGESRDFFLAVSRKSEKKLFRFGPIEHIPVGFNLALGAGVSYFKDFKARPFALLGILALQIRLSKKFELEMSYHKTAQYVRQWKAFSFPSVFGVGISYSFGVEKS